MSKAEQNTSTVFMVKPMDFKYNTQTAETNSFMNSEYGKDPKTAAMKESDDYVALLKTNGVKVVRVEDTLEPETPDSVFPNNWFSTHEGGIFVLYPMCAPNRRLERKEVFLAAIKENFNITKTVDLTHWENEGKFLEGTGSMVLDRVNKIVYACRSPRTNEAVLDDFCKQLGYKKVTFDAKDAKGNTIYHTNVVMSVAENFAVLCIDSIVEEKQKNEVIESLKKTNKRIITITFDQMNKFAGNVLEIKNKEGKKLLIMSQTAFNNFTKEQLEDFEKDCTILHPMIECIEVIGGGSARCMLAEIF